MKLRDAIKSYFESKGYAVLSVDRLGEGFVAEGYKVEYQDGNISKKVVCRRLQGNGMSHDYLSDRVGYLLLQHQIANTHPNHVRSIDVVSFGDKVQTVSLEGLEDVFQIVEFASGRSYYELFTDIKNGLTENQNTVIRAISEHMKLIHKVKPDVDDTLVRNHYWRHSQDFIGSEVLMDILDIWPLDELMPLSTRTEFISKLYKLREETRILYSRCSLVHSDLHPDNIRVREDYSIQVLDSARSIWGEPMDDLTSMLANYIFYGIKYPEYRKEYQDAYFLMLDSYFSKDNIDSDSNRIARIFFSVRLLILSHPVFFSSDSFALKIDSIQLAMQILSKDDFKLNEVWELI